MKNFIIALTLILTISVPSLVFAGSRYHVGVSGGSHGSHFSVGISGGSYHRSYRSSTTIVRRGNSAIHYRGATVVPRHRYPQRSTYYGHRPVYNGSNHIHRQAGRRYVNDYPCAPVVVVPSTRVYHYYEY